MRLDEMESLTAPMVALLEADGWTVETLATATIKALVPYKGIGKVTAKNAIIEAGKLMNREGLDNAKQLEKEYYYQKSPPRKILNDWGSEGLSVQNVALASARGLAALKGIDEVLALRIISAAQSIVNELKLYESRVSMPSNPGPTVASSAFPIEWLDGTVEPPLMGVRVERNFKRAKEAYENERTS